MRTAIPRSMFMLVGACLVTFISHACDQRGPNTTIVPTAPTVPQAPAVHTVTLCAATITSAG